jgi:hypothetical protein
MLTQERTYGFFPGEGVGMEYGVLQNYGVVESPSYGVSGVMQLCSYGLFRLWVKRGPTVIQNQPLKCLS